MSLQDRLEQALEDKRLHNMGANKEIAAIRKQIADAEVTYSIGDRFVRASDTDKYILVSDGDGNCLLICLADGETWAGSAECVNSNRISKDELAEIRNRTPFTRYYDARKQCKC